MKPEQQRIAIAEACGWKTSTETVEHTDGYQWTETRKFWLSPTQKKDALPDYFNDLNAIHEAVKSLPQNLKPRYFAYLCTVASGAISLNGYSEATEATAAQRAEAFLKTLNLWTP